MATVRNVILNVDAQGGEAVAQLHSIADAIRRIPNRRTAEVRADVAQAQTKIAEMRAQLAAIDRTKVKPELSVEITKALLQLDRFEKRVKSISDISPEVTIKADRLMAEIAAVEARLQRLGTERPEVQVQADTARAEADLKRLQATRDKLVKNQNENNIDLQVEIDQATAQIALVEDELRVLAATDPQVHVNVESARAQAQLAALRAELAALPNTATIDVDQRGEILRGLLALEQGFVGLGAGMARASRPARTFGQEVQHITQQVKQLTPIVNGLAIVIGTALVPAILALGGTAAGAVFGLGGMATTIAATLVPAIVGLVAVFQQLKQVTDAVKLITEANDAAQLRATKGTQEYRAAVQQRATAENGLRDALEGVESSERSLGLAREQARQAITAAERQMTDAETAHARSVVTLQRATVDAYREMEDAAEAASDAIRDVAAAELEVDQASLDLRRAKKELADFRKGAGLAGSAVSEAFKKFTDVEVDFDAGKLDKLLSSLAPDIDTGKALDLEQLILNVRKAKEQEKGATDDLSDSERTLKRAREDNAKFQQLGIAASEQLVGAREAERDAARQLGDATARYNELAQAGIAKAPAVVAALEAERDAHQRLRDAQRNVRQVDAKPPDAAKAEQAWNRLSDAQQRFALGLLLARTRWQQFKQAISGSAVDAAAGGLATISTLLQNLTPEFRRVGDAIGNSFRNLGITLAINQPLLKDLTGGAADLINALGAEAFPRFVRLMMNLGRLFLPTVLDLSRRLAAALGRAGDATGNFQKAQPFVDAFAHSLRSVLRFVGAVVGAFLEIGRVVGPFGDELVDWATKGVRAFRKWLASAEGQKDVRRFFEATIPAMKAIIKFTLTLGRIFLKLIQFVSPFLEGFVDGLNFVLGLIEKVIDLANWLTAGSLVQGVERFVGAWLAFGGVVRVVARVLQAFKKLPAGVQEAVGDVGAWLSKPFVRAGRALFSVAVTLGKKIINGVKHALGIDSPSKAMAALVPDLVAGLAQGIVQAAQLLLRLGRRIWHGIRDGIRAAAEAVIQTGIWIVEKVAEGVRSVGSFILKIGGSIIDGIVAGIRAGLKAGGKLLTAVADLGRAILRKVREVLGIHSPSTEFAKIGGHIIDGLVKGLSSRGTLDSLIRDTLGAKGVITIGTLWESGALSAVSDRLPGPLKLTTPGWFFRGKDHTDDVLKRSSYVPISAGAPGKNVPTLIYKGVKGLGDTVRKNIMEGLLGLASGGLVTGPTAALIGEGRHREAVLPLSRAVMRMLAQAISVEMGGALAPAGAGARLPSRGLTPAGPAPPREVHRGPRTLIQGGIQLQVPGGGNPDGRASAVLLGRELERRG